MHPVCIYEELKVGLKASCPHSTAPFDSSFFVRFVRLLVFSTRSTLRFSFDSFDFSFFRLVRLLVFRSTKGSTHSTSRSHWQHKHATRGHLNAFTIFCLEMRFTALSLCASVFYPRATLSFSFSRFGVVSRSFSLARKLNMSTSSTASNKEALLNCPTIKLLDGTLHPSIGFGTYKVGFIPSSASSAATDAKVERTARECVKDALQVGYRFLECAQFYGNEVEVGKAIQESGIPREELFLCSKVWTTTIEQGRDAIRAQVEQTLADLQTDYVDLYLVHWPVPGHHVEAYKTLLELQEEGKIRGVGVSNYAWEDYLELKEAGITQVPLVNQIEINPFLYRKNTISNFEKEGVVMQSYRSLRDGKAFEHPVLKKIAAAHDKTTAQVLGRWCVQHGFVYVPKSVKKERMIENAQVFDFELANEEMAELDALTSDEAYDTFQALYRKCVNRDTSKDGTMDGVKMNITID